MKEEFSFYVGVDWGVEFHQACILDAHGEKICQRYIEHSGSGMLEFCDSLQALTNGEASALAVAIEVPRGPIVPLSNVIEDFRCDWSGLWGSM